VTARKPHILLIMADQLSALFLPAYGHNVVKTPHLDRLAAEGVVFENAYTPSPLCAPARATFMSGMLPSRTGVYDNAAEFPSAVPTFAHYLRLEGYRTCLSGKMHFVGPDQLHGFEERLTTDIYPADFGWTPDWRLKQERIDWWYHNMTSVKQAGIAEITNQLEYDDEVAFHAKRRLYDHARYEPESPLCLVVSFTHPHDPYAARPEFWNLYRHDDIDMPAMPSMSYSDLDPHSRRLWDIAAMDDYEITPEDVRSARHGYYASISYVDSKIGELLETLSVCGMADETIVIVTSDHGDFLGERGLWYKMSFLEPSARVPLLVSGPKRFAPGRAAEPVSLADVAPTLVDLAASGSSPRLVSEMDGQSLVPFLDGGNYSRTVYGEYLAEGVVAPMFMIRRDRWKYVRCQTDPGQLFDLASDPRELKNLASDPAHSATLYAFARECGARWNASRVTDEVTASQRARLMLFQALRRGAHFPWDYQPLRKASEQYTRNHMDVTARDQRSRLPLVAEPAKRGQAN
jgi:choline-sulfatase